MAKVLKADVATEFPKLLGLAKKARLRLKNQLDKMPEGTLPGEEWRELFRWVIDCHVRVSSEQRQWEKQNAGEVAKMSEAELIEQIRRVVLDMTPAEREAILGGEH